MGFSLTATLLCLAAAAAGQTPVQTPNSSAGQAAATSLEGTCLVDALIKISTRFQVPLGIEWAKSADTLKPARVSWTGSTTVADVVRSVVSAYAGYAFEDIDGLIHVFRRDLMAESRNPLNIIVKGPARTETLGLADNNLRSILDHAARHPDRAGIAGSVPGYAEEPVIRFTPEGTTARNILNKIVSVPGAAQPPNSRIWITTFPENLLFSKTGYLEVATTVDPALVSEQPFWILLRWGDPAPERMLR